LSTIVKIPDTRDKGEPQTEVNVGVQGATLAPLTGTNLKSLENPSGSSEDSPSESSIHTGEELDDLNVKPVLEATIASYNISRRTIVDTLKERAQQHVDNALKLKEGGPISDQEYIRIAREVVNYEVKHYVVKKHLHTQRSESMVSSHDTAIMHSKAFRVTGKQKEPEIGQLDTQQGRAGPSSSQLSRTEIILPETKTAPTVSTSMDEDHRAPFHKPPPANWRDRVHAQWARNQAQRETGQSLISDQGVVFDGHILYDAWTIPWDTPDTGGDKEVDTTVKRELEHSTLTESKTAGLSANYNRHTAKHAHFIGNTSITPMSQQFYPGRLNPGADPLLGPRLMDHQDEDPEPEDIASSPSRN
jgi:hypothetical protein